MTLACRSFPGAGRSEPRLRILALLRAMELSVGRAGAGARPKPAARVAPCPDPGRGRAGRAAQGRQLGVPAACRRRRAPSRCSTLIDRWSDERAEALFAADARPAGGGPRRPRRSRRALFRGACRGVGQHPLAPCRRQRGRAGDRRRCSTDEPIGALARHRHRHRPDARIVRARAPSSAIGIDRSSEMLRLARVKLEAARIARRQPAPGRHVCAAAGRRQRRQRDPPPGASLSPSSRRRRSPRRRGCWRPGGRLLVVDFAPHEREESARAATPMSGLALPTRRCAAGSRAAGLEARPYRTIWKAAN